MDNLPLVYLGIGGNIGETRQIIFSCAEQIASLPNVYHFKLSRLYQTSPVSAIPQRDYLNAACSFQTSLTPFELLDELKKIEKNLGKTTKLQNNAPRVIDIDILFFGRESLSTPTLEVPHPRWKERLFVLIPLSDLTQKIAVPCQSSKIDLIDLPALIAHLRNSSHEIVCEEVQAMIFFP